MSDLISRQAAIDAVAKFVPYAICDESTESYTNALAEGFTVAFESGFAEAKRMAIEALENALTFSTATDAVKALREAEYRGYMRAIAERPQGEWINYYQDGICHFVGTCSACGNRNDIPPIESAHYCPSCGAKMKGVYDE